MRTPTRPLDLATLTLALLGCARDDWRDRRNAARTTVTPDAALDGTNDIVTTDAPDDAVPTVDVPTVDVPSADAAVDAPPRAMVAQMVSAAQLTFARTTDGRVYATGRNAGAFEGFELAHRNTFVRVEGVTGAEQISIASRVPVVLCVRHGDGTVACKQGRNVPVAVQGLADAQQIAGRCALRANGEVACWDVSSLRATPVAGLSDVVHLAGDGAQHCVVLRGGTVSCWGAVGSVRDMPPTGRIATTPEAVTGVTGATMVAVGRFSVCAALTSGIVMCWGRRAEIAIGSSSENMPPTAVVNASGAPVRTLTAHAALREDGTVTTWGNGIWGARGDGTYTASTGSVVVPGMRARAMLEGDTDQHLCAVDEGGVASCWGYDEYGQLGCGGGAQRWPLPALANPEATGDRMPLTDVTDAMLTASAACVRRGDGSVWCWGGPDNGMLADGTATPAPPWRLTPRRVADLSMGVTSLLSSGSTPRDVFGVLLDDGTARFWGMGTQGAVGDGVPQVRTRPTAPARLSNVQQVSAGLEHACARRDGTVWCWGKGSSGELGDGSMTNSTTPVQVMGITNAVDIAMGPDVSLALLSDGSMRLWGLSTSVLAVARANPTPVALPALAGVTKLITVMPHDWRQVCALRNDGRVSCIGDNLSQRYAWVDMGLENVTQLGGSPAFIGCARHSTGNGTASCWGINRWSAVGDPALPNTEAYVTPQLVRNEDGTPFDGVVSVRPGIGMVCAVRDGGTLWCWGASSNGLMGRGLTTAWARARPVIGL